MLIIFSTLDDTRQSQSLASFDMYTYIYIYGIVDLGVVSQMAKFAKRRLLNNY